MIDILKNKKSLSLCGLCVLVAGVSAVSQPTRAVETRAKIGWKKMPLLPPEAKKAGIYPGGEGGQWPRWTIAISPDDPDFMLLPIDVGGLYRTVDGGKNWKVSMQGWNARGANAFAIDPKNADRVLGVGGNSLDWNKDWGQPAHGIYVSVDKARSWKQTLAVPDGLAGQVIFDPTSFDRKRGFCTRAFYSAPLSGLFRSEDGGQSWTKLSDIAATEHNDLYNAALLAVHPKRGWLYLAGKNGLQVSKDRGQSFAPLYRDGAVWGLSVIDSAPDRVYFSGIRGVFVSDDAGTTFSALPAKGISNVNEPVRQITVNSLDPQRMFCWQTGPQWKRYISQDGGKTFQSIRVEEGLARRPLPGAKTERSANWNSADSAAIPGGWAPLPLNSRNGQFTWHPKKAHVAFGLGGDWVTKSSDGGQTFRWWNNGYNGMILGSSMGISPHEPNTVFLSIQDYNGAFTLDGGATWNYRDVSGKGWGGHCYGGFAVDKQVMWTGESENWNPPRRTRISRDGGNTWNIALGPDGKECTWEGADVSYCDPQNRDILFASNWRSTDKGVTWNRMADCDGVFTHAPDGRLFGRKGDKLVVSANGGATFRVLVAVPGGISDIAYDHKNDRFYIASQETLKVWDDGKLGTIETPRDQYNNTKVTTVAVDPVLPQIVYAGGARNIYATSATVFRSTDAGKTWANLTAGDGPHEVQAIRVHPQTREAWVNGQCFGMWRLAPPKRLETSPPSTRIVPRQPTLAPVAG